ncbi:von Willebrand factor [Didymella exigua CBS 183.55]|uniref:von Willebrand factor n=1 Tax=Didymella exigua CBS 183.55 TaxID=1150837 RepID=A0A6A5RNI9_9PLEO|nr:von Willebrand factor [Didymella exigua CBS 183.55]KAF1927087.1 von Willebrand factor [Didymella exigua CBS 183.55]
MFSSLKKKLSRRSSNLLSDTTPVHPAKSVGSGSSRLAPPPVSNPYSSVSPVTRRPNSANTNLFTSSSDAPPAYSPGPAQNAQLTMNTSSTAPTADDQYAFLKSFDTIFLIDDSGSMAGRSWRETGKALETITPICTERDADGIDIYFLNHPDSSIYRNVTAARTVIEIFQTVRPGGATPTGQRLHKILKPYLQRYEKDPEATKPMNVIVITDGEPSDDVEAPIIACAKKLDKLDAPAWQIGIQFFQVGKEAGAREALKQLDDGLREVSGDDELRDIVDTVPLTGDDDTELTGEGVLKVQARSKHPSIPPPPSA